MATRRSEIFRDHHITIRSGDPPTADPAAFKPRNGIKSATVRKTDPEPRELSNAGLSGSRPEITDIARRDMIELAAYYRAAQRGFEPGHELTDWLAAERDVEWFLAGGLPPNGLEGR
jgi:hypothetical protein